MLPTNRTQGPRASGAGGLSAAALPGAASAVLKIVRVKNDGGSAGGVGEQCSFTYSIYAATADVDADDPLATELTPQVPPRTSTGTYVVAEDGSYATAFIDPETGDWVLWQVRERPDVEGCDG